ncbi:hypothetical protein OLCHANIL_00121 [Vibrio phage V05]|uniref:Uncharacterized protein n=2 Tax=Schizotequatrovirus KVP40 TaxID=1914019 RepID=A0A6B9STA2_9CAUD|nr:hypothetical protein pp2_204 [Vibrio phage phi-pp2]QHJ74389.1 hypothetical protein VH12019_00062 [Vibrio phage VH1_2019]QIW90218.1 hypothetical protein OLCHANIL_00121 [Vibrio phage V05]UNA01723.1 hypothetical protein [Vibrio phage PC-Liy1]URQ03019.1 hypothetical protein PVA8_33 [Vibrio phage PVA8]WBM58755.1 hypothetical protein vBValMPVA8_33 [Vibrio phage vB_ValM_PVA8]WOL24740.1 hypothetical protein [Vibrio phage PG216]
MKATQKQIELCNLLIDNGAPFELKHPHEDSIEAADQFIKANRHYLQRGIVKHENYYHKAVENGLMPEDIGVWNM